jgi:hypothetical protein
MSEEKKEIKPGPKATEMVKPAQELSGKGNKYKALVNMHLPNGSVLVKDEECDVNEEDHKHLANSFGEGLKHIVE